MNQLAEKIFSEFNYQKCDIREYSPLALAYLGDAVYELFIRTIVLLKGNAPVYKLHKHSIEYVKAGAQSDTVHRIFERLTPEEQDIVRRGRNAKVNTVPKNADVVEYKYATGFESLIGYLYLKQDYTRMMKVLEMCL